MHLSKVLSLASIVLGVLFYLAGVLGLLWPKSPPMDVGLLSTSVLFVLFGLVGLLLTPKTAAA
ncbi:MAG TPA: hypothetical protein VM241_04025 [Candidatus Thermoplasmatota archaeon]|nr:hypothetical protein [Candidatus Thermoplasmatota archaeon]